MRLAVPVPPVLLEGLVVVVAPAGFVVVVAPAVVVVVAAELDDDDELVLDDDELVLDDEVLALDDDDVLEDDDDDVLEDDCCGFGLVVVVAACVVGLESSRSPGLARASATPATRTTIAAINRSGARDLM